MNAERVEWLSRHQRGKCYYCKRDLSQSVTDCHHLKAHNTKANRMKYPTLIDSAVNVVLVCRACHDKRGNERRADDGQLEVLEKLLSAARDLFAVWPVDERALYAEIEFIRRDIEKGFKWAALGDDNDKR